MALEPTYASAEVTPHRIVHVVHSLAVEFGGPAFSVPELALAQSELISEVKLLHRIPAAGDPIAAQGLLASRPGHRLIVEPLTRWGQLDSSISAADLVHVHGLWEITAYRAVRTASRRGIPYVIAPSGTLRPDALRRKSMKKKIALTLDFRRRLQQASALHATSLQEAREMRALGLRSPIAVIPIGLHVDQFMSNGESDLLNSRWPELRGKRRLVFLGRIHPIKGLENLAAAWGLVAPEASDWQLVIAGPDEGGYRKRVEGALAAAGVSDRTTFTGEISGEDKCRMFRESDALVLPSISENFGFCVCEALAAGLPVIASRGTPWEGLETEGCGYWVEPAVEPLADGIRKLVDLEDRERRAMGARGRDWVAREFTAEASARALSALHSWVLGGSRPNCLHLEPEPRAIV
jgi:glycosyltransferase involved in cell wall biosynthesis